MAKMIEDLKARLSVEVEAAKYELNVELPKEIRKATELGDLSENAEYKSALERQQYLRARIGQLITRLQDLSMLNVERLPQDRVAFGTTMEVFDLDRKEEMTFTLVMPEDADLDKGLISLSSPLGKGFIGREEGDEVQIRTPNGLRRFEINALTTLHHKE